MSVIGVPQYLAALRQRHGEVKHELAQAQHMTQQYHQRKTELKDRRDQALRELTHAILPDFTPAQLERARQVTGYQAIHSGLVDAMAEDQARLQQRQAEIEADPRWRDRERLRHPDAGELTLAIQEIESHREALLPTVRACEQHPRFRRLIVEGYGTPDYKVGFWRLSYYLDWKAGDEIMEKFPDKKSFAELATEYKEADVALRTMDQRLAELRAEFEAGAQLEREHAEVVNRLANLEAIHLDQARVKIAEFLKGCPSGALAERLSANPDLITMTQRWVGLEKQVKYLDEVHERTLVPVIADLHREEAKLNKDFVKYSRPKHSSTRFQRSELETRLGTRRDKIRKRLERYEYTQETIYIFNDYNRGSLAEDFLWWDVITDGDLDGNFIPEVQEFHHHHPGYRYERRWDDSDAAAVSAGTHRDSSVAYDAS